METLNPGPGQLEVTLKEIHSVRSDDCMMCLGICLGFGLAAVLCV